MNIQRREFMLGAAAVLLAGQSQAAEPEKLRAAVIGHTGKGDYGHGLDMIFYNHPRFEIVGLADPDEAGRAKAAKRCKAPRQYADWREMLEKEKPNVVSIAPRQTGERMEMLSGAIAAGAHIVCEKPFCRSPVDGDKILASAGQKKLKIAVTHQMRLGPSVVHLKKKIEAGLIGELQEMKAFGKQDRRAGGEDIAVLGVHLFDLMRMFAGAPHWCSARILEKGHEVTAADVKAATEDLGPILGDDIEAQVAFDQGVLGAFTSRAGLHDYAGKWGVEFIGSKGVARINADIWPTVFVRTAEKWGDAGQAVEWHPIDDDPALKATPAERSVSAGNRRLVDDWLSAIAEDREPVCNGANAAKAVETVHAIWRAGLSRGRVELPLKERGPALG